MHTGDLVEAAAQRTEGLLQAGLGVVADGEDGVQTEVGDAELLLETRVLLPEPLLVADEQSVLLNLLGEIGPQLLLGGDHGGLHSVSTNR